MSKDEHGLDMKRKAETLDMDTLRDELHKLQSQNVLQMSESNKTAQKMNDELEKFRQEI